MKASLDNFYLPLEGNARSPFRATIPSSLVLSVTEIDEYVAGSRIPPTPIPFVYSSGSNMYDWIWTELATAILPTELVTVMRQSNLTGWSTYPIELRDACDEVMPGYVGLSVKGRSGPLDDSSIPITQEKSSFTGRLVPQRRGFFFDITTWDGSDFFCPAKSRMILVSERVRDIFKRKKIKNVFLERITESVRVGTTSVPK